MEREADLDMVPGSVSKIQTYPETSDLDHPSNWKMVRTRSNNSSFS
jgi:hypothetical protein